MIGNYDKIDTTPDTIDAGERRLAEIDRNIAYELALAYWCDATDLLIMDIEHHTKEPAHAQAS